MTEELSFPGGFQFNLTPIALKSGLMVILSV